MEALATIYYMEEMESMYFSASMVLIPYTVEQVPTQSMEMTSKLTD